MKPHRIFRPLFVCALAWAFAASSHHAFAQNPKLKPTYGSVNLNAGFTPDPFVKQLVAGGNLQTSLGGVKTHVANAPDFQLFYSAGNFPLHIYVEAKADTTLLVRQPNGQWLANDDGGVGRNPSIFLNRPLAGRYDIWVGTFVKSSTKATLLISERAKPTTKPPPVVAKLNICGAENPGKTEASQSGGFQLVGDVNRRWKDRERIHVRFYGGSQKLRDQVMDYAGDWTRFANLYLDFSNSGNPDVRVHFDPNGGHWSKVGTDANRTAATQATMNLAINDSSPPDEIRRVSLHEFGHAMGFVHEHQNPNGGIRWNKEKAYAYFERTQGWDRAKIDHNIFQTYNRDSVNATRFDRGSIMLYSIPAELTQDGFSTPWNTNLSEMDKRHAARLYPWTPHSLVHIVNGTTGNISFQYKWQGSDEWRSLPNSSRRLAAGASHDFWQNAGKSGQFHNLLVRFDNGKGESRTVTVASRHWQPARTDEYPDFSTAPRYVFRFENGELRLARGN